MGNDIATRVTADVSDYETGMARVARTTRGTGEDLRQLVRELERKDAEMRKSASASQTYSQRAAKASQGGKGTELDRWYAAELARRADAQQAAEKRREDIEREAAARRAAAQKAENDRIVEADRRRAVERAEIARWEAQERADAERQAELRQREQRTRADSRSAANYRRDDRNVQKQLQDSGYFDRWGDGANKASRRLLIFMEATRAAEDGIYGFTNNGLKGMAQGLGNNVGMIGSLVGGTLGLKIAVGGVLLVLAASYIPALYNWATGSKEVTDKTKEQTASQTKLNDAIERTVSLRERLISASKLDSKSSAESSLDTIEKDRRRRDVELNAIKNGLSQFNETSGVGGLDSNGQWQTKLVSHVRDNLTEDEKKKRQELLDKQNQLLEDERNARNEEREIRKQIAKLDEEEAKQRALDITERRRKFSGIEQDRTAAENAQRIAFRKSFNTGLRDAEEGLLGSPEQARRRLEREHEQRVKAIDAAPLSDQERQQRTEQSRQLLQRQSVKQQVESSRDFLTGLRDQSLSLLNPDVAAKMRVEQEHGARADQLRQMQFGSDNERKRATEASDELRRQQLAKIDLDTERRRGPIGDITSTDARSAAGVAAIQKAMRGNGQQTTEQIAAKARAKMAQSLETMVQQNAEILRKIQTGEPVTVAPSLFGGSR